MIVVLVGGPKDCERVEVEDGRPYLDVAVPTPFRDGDYADLPDMSEQPSLTSYRYEMHPLNGMDGTSPKIGVGQELTFMQAIYRLAAWYGA